MRNGLLISNDRQGKALTCYMYSPLYLEDERRITSQLHKLKKGELIDDDWLYNSITEAIRRGIVTFYNTYGEELNNPELLSKLKKASAKCDQSFKPSTLRQLVRHIAQKTPFYRRDESKVEKECIGISDIEKI